MRINSIDHIVLSVEDIEITAAFYKSVLGMVVEKFAGDRTALKFGNQKINLHKYGNEFKPNANKAQPGSEDICFITDIDLDVAMNHVTQCGVKIIEGPVLRTGSVGQINSFYFRDPDGNLIEVANHYKV